MIFFTNKKKFLSLNFFDVFVFSNNKFLFIYNCVYFLFFFFILLSISGSFFQINSNFLLFFTFSFFFIFIHYCFSNFDYYSLSYPNIILENIDNLLDYNIISLYFLKYSILNNNLIFFKNIFIYIKSFNLLVFFSTITPIEVNLNVRNFLLSKVDDLSL
jgi:hypothetical protein